MPGGGVLHHIFGREVRQTITKMDPIGSKVFKKEGSIRSKTNEKGSQLDKKLRRNVLQNGEHLCKIIQTCLN